MCACELNRVTMREHFHETKVENVIRYYVKRFDDVKDEIYYWSNDINSHLKKWQTTLSNIKIKINKNRSEIDKSQNDKQMQTIQKWTSELIQAINKLISSQISFVSTLVLVNIDIKLYDQAAQYNDDVLESNANHQISYHQGRVV